MKDKRDIYPYAALLAIMGDTSPLNRDYTKEDQDYHKYRLVQQRRQAKELAQRKTATYLQKQSKRVNK